MTDYSRQTPLALNMIETATVVGCGGTGAWTAIFLAMSGVKTLVLYDEDTLDGSNLNRLPFTARDIGYNKTYLVKRYLAMLRPDCFVVEHRHKITEENVNTVTGTIFCCTDDLKSQRLLQSYCKANGWPYQRVGYDGTALNVSKAFPLSFSDEEEPAGYRFAPSWVVPSVFAASAGVFSQMKKEITLMDDMASIGCLGTSVVPQFLKDRIHKNSYDEGYDDGKHDDTKCNDCERRDCDGCDWYSPDYHGELMRDAFDEMTHEFVRCLTERDTSFDIDNSQLRDRHRNPIGEALSNIFNDMTNDAERVGELKAKVEDLQCQINQLTIEKDYLSRKLLDKPKRTRARKEKVEDGTAIQI